MTTISGQKQISLEKSFYTHCHPKGLDLKVLFVIIYSTALTTQAPLWKSGFPYFDEEKEQSKRLISPT